MRLNPVKTMMPAPEPITVRALNEGEWVDYSELGVTGLQLSGESVRVAVHEEGEPTIVSLPVELRYVIKQFAFVALALDTRLQLGPREIRFVRKYLSMQHAEFAEALGISEDRILAIESMKELPTHQQVCRIRALMILRLTGELNAEHPPAHTAILPMEVIQEVAPQYGDARLRQTAVEYLADVFAGETIQCAEGVKARIESGQHRSN